MGELAGEGLAGFAPGGVEFYHSEGVRGGAGFEEGEVLFLGFQGDYFLFGGLRPGVLAGEAQFAALFSLRRVVVRVVVPVLVDFGAVGEGRGGWGL